MAETPRQLRERLRALIDSEVFAKVKNQQTGIETLKRQSAFNVSTGRDIPDLNASIRSGSVEDSRLNGGKPTLIPFVHNGLLLSASAATDAAVASGKTFPAFDTNEQATVASKELSARLGRAKNQSTDSNQ